MVDNNSNSFIPVAPPSGLPARLGRNLAARRKALGLTQAQVAERLEVETETCRVSSAASMCPRC